MARRAPPLTESARRFAKILGRRESQRQAELLVAERAWAAGRETRTAQAQLAARYQFAAGYIGSPLYRVGRQLERARPHDIIGPILHEEPIAVVQARLGRLGEHRDEPLSGWSMERLALAVCDRWVRWGWMESLTFIEPVGLDVVERCMPVSDLERLVRDLYLGLARSESPPDRAVTEMADVWLQLGPARCELADYFERLVDHVIPEEHDAFIARRLDMPTAQYDLLDCLITKRALKANLGMQGVGRLKTRARGAFPDPVHRAQPGSGYSSVYRLGELLQAFQALVGHELQLQPGIEKLVEPPHASPSWEKSARKARTVP